MGMKIGRKCADATPQMTFDFPGHKQGSFDVRQGCGPLWYLILIQNCQQSIKTDFAVFFCSLNRHNLDYEKSDYRGNYICYQFPTDDDEYNVWYF